MSRSSVHERVSPVAYPPDLTPELQIALSELADVETRYEVERREIERFGGPTPLKKRLLGRLENRHTRERQPLVQRLGDLQRQMTWARFGGQKLHS
jgi:hypothetical protein